MSAADPVVERWAQGFSASAALPPHEDGLPAHHPQCLGCGPDNPHGHHLQVWRDGDRVRSRHVFDPRHVGAPGIAHGGAVATVLDDLFGFVLYVVGDLAVTRHLEVGYRAPVLLGDGKPALADLQLAGLWEAHDRWRLTDRRHFAPDTLEIFTRTR